MDCTINGKMTKFEKAETVSLSDLFLKEQSEMHVFIGCRFFSLICQSRKQNKFIDDKIFEVLCFSWEMNYTLKVQRGNIQLATKYSVLSTILRIHKATRHIKKLHLFLEFSPQLHTFKKCFVVNKATYPYSKIFKNKR